MALGRSVFPNGRPGFSPLLAFLLVSIALTLAGVFAPLSSFAFFALLACAASQPFLVPLPFFAITIWVVIGVVAVIVISVAIVWVAVVVSAAAIVRIIMIDASGQWQEH
jgi:hypothetical protein